MTRARGLLLGGACFATLIGADGGAVPPVAVGAAPVVVRATVASTARSPAAVVAYRSAAASASRAVPSRRWQLVHVGLRKVPLDTTPVISSVAPTVGPSAGGTSIVILGTGFTDTTDVLIGSTDLTLCGSAPCFTIVSDSEIDATTAASPAGTSDVIITNPTFQSSPNPPTDYFTYLDLPTVSNVASPQSEGATGITVTGSNFSIPGPPATSAVTEVDLAPTFAGPTVALTTLCSSSGQPDCFDFTNDTHMPIDLPATNILPGQYDTVVTTPGGISTTTGNDQFVVQQDTPTVTSVSPDSGPQSGGAPAITIGGSGFIGSGFTTTGVSFGGTAASFSVTNSTTITATPPSGTGLVDITVTTSSTDGTSVQTSTTSAADTYAYAPVPAVTNVVPNVGPSGGHNGPVVLTGTGFESNNGVSNANFAATDVFVGLTDIGLPQCPGSPTNPCFTLNSPSKITLQDMPPHSAVPVDITVETVGGTSATSSNDQYTYQLIPAVTGVAPTAGVLGGGNTITVSGSDFTGATDVFVGGADITTTPCGASPCFNVTGSTTITIHGLPSHTAGTVDIIVQTPAGRSSTTPADEYAYAPVPTVTNVTPGDGSVAGTNTITVAGTGFSSGAFFSATRVTVGGTPITATSCPVTPTNPCFTVTNPTSITVKDLPGHVAGTVDITVTTAGGTSPTSVNDQYLYVNVPTVTAVVPPTGPAAGGTAVTLTGTDFQGSGFTASDVFVDAIDLLPCPGAHCFTVVSPTSITINSMPAHAAGFVDITVQTTGGTSAPSSADHYTYEPLPTVTSVAPPAGVLAGGNAVTVDGTGFTGATVVNVGTQLCPVSACFTVVSDTQITVSSMPPGGSPGTVDVTVTTPFGTSLTTSADSYTYMPVPTVTVVNPNAGSPAGLNSVTLTGTGFEVGGVTATTVSFVGLGNAAGFTVTSATTITIPAIPVGPSLGGQFHITVTTAGGTSAQTSADIYTYVASFPTVTTVSPKFGATGGNAYVIIIGANFGDPNQGFGATSLLFNAKNVSVHNSFPCSGSANGCFLQIDQNTIDVYTPALPAGTVDIKVETPGGDSNAAPADQYTYVAPGAYTAISPVRICDTRPAAGGIAANQCDTGGKGTLGTGHETVTAQITGTHVPSGAQAVVVNITAINHGGGGTYVIAYPAGGAQPVASNINLTGGKVGSNLAIVELGTNTGFVGQISLFNALGSADVIVDIEGYFSTAAGGPAGAFHSIPPLRICDSRGGTGNTTICATASHATSDPLKGGLWRLVQLSGVPPGTSLTVPHIPTDGTAAAAVFNLTATGGTAPATYLSVAVPTGTIGSESCPSSAPSFSNLNPGPGMTLPNRVISNLGPNQDICLYNAVGIINFVIDVNGWFGTASAPTGSFFYSVPPTRICDTRPSLGTRCQNQPLGAGLTGELIHVAGILAVPASLPHATAYLPVAVAVVANLTAVSGNAATYFTLYPSDAIPKPKASDLNPSAGQVIANLAITGLGQLGATTVGNVNLYNAVGSINAILDVAGWFQ